MLKSGLPNPGDVIGQFKILRLLGQGGQAAVFEALQDKLDREVAVKIVLPHVVERLSNIDKRFAREINLVKRLEHPNIVRLYDFGETPDGLPWMAMEIVRGEDLEQTLLSSKRLSPKRALRVALQTLSGLAAAHEEEIVHRDLKPSNLMLTRKGADHDVVKILDFGIGKALGESEDKSIQDLTGPLERSHGTPHYMAPELLKNEVIGPHCDVYAVGLILCEMLTGEKAIPGQALSEVIAAQIYRQVELPEWLETSPLAPVLRRATSKDYRERYANALEFHAALEELDPRDIVAPLLAASHKSEAKDAPALGASPASLAPTGPKLGLAKIPPPPHKDPTPLPESPDVDQRSVETDFPMVNDRVPSGPIEPPDAEYPPPPAPVRPELGMARHSGAPASLPGGMHGGGAPSGESDVIPLVSADMEAVSFSMESDVVPLTSSDIEIPSEAFRGPPPLHAPFKPSHRWGAIAFVAALIVLVFVLAFSGSDDEPSGDRESAIPTLDRLGDALARREQARLDRSAVSMALANAVQLDHRDAAPEAWPDAALAPALEGSPVEETAAAQALPAEDAAAAQAEPPAAVWEIVTHPTGAMVVRVADDVVLCESTPCSLTLDPDQNAVELAIVREGYERQNVALPTSKGGDLELALTARTPALAVAPTEGSAQADATADSAPGDGPSVQPDDKPKTTRRRRRRRQRRRNTDPFSARTF